MEIGGIGGKNNVHGVAVERGEPGPAGQQTSAELRRAVSDVLRISQEGREKIKNLLDPDWVKEQVESANQQAEATAKELKTQRECMLIASQVMAGDKVPPEDLKYLAEHDIKLYSLAISMRRNKPDPEKCDRVSEDEEEAARSAEQAPAQEVFAPEAAPAAPEGGGTPEGGAEG